jgi:hypothetical protein
MTIFTKKGGNFVPLTREQIRRMRRVDQVVAVEKLSQQLLNTSRALAGWMESVEKKHLKMDAHDLVVTRLPNIERVQLQCDALDKALKELRRV